VTFDSKQLARLIMLADDRIEARELAAYVIGGGCAGRHGGGEQKQRGNEEVFSCGSIPTARPASATRIASVSATQLKQ
jgi:hypothetical protein